MARPRREDMALVAQAQALAIEATSVDELRCAQAVLLPALLDATLEQTAAALGVARATVARYQTRLRDRVDKPNAPAPQWGGRRHAAMSLAEERSFLEPWRQLSAEGGVLVVSPIRAALAQRLGHPVAASVVYRMLARHGWRKVAPDTRHPKSDPAVQEEWKKNFQGRWQPC
jgi:transposase